MPIRGRSDNPFSEGISIWGQLGTHPQTAYYEIEYKEHSCWSRCVGFGATCCFEWLHARLLRFKSGPRVAQPVVLSGLSARTTGH